MLLFKESDWRFFYFLFMLFSYFHVSFYPHWHILGCTMVSCVLEELAIIPFVCVILEITILHDGSRFYRDSVRYS